MPSLYLNQDYYMILCDHYGISTRFDGRVGKRLASGNVKLPAVPCTTNNFPLSTVNISAVFRR